MTGPKGRFEDPTVASSWVAAILVVGGLVTIFLSWRGVSGTLDVPVQVPHLVGGGLGGLALVIGAGTIVNVQVTRRLAIRERDMLDRILDDARHVVGSLGSGHDTDI